MLDAEGNVHLVDKTEIVSDPEISTFFDARTDVVFNLYTRNNRASPQILRLNDANSVRNSNFAAGKPTRYVIHGWNNNRDSDVNNLIRTAYLNKADVNVIVIDWSKANNAVYSTTRYRVPEAAAINAEFIDFMASQIGQPVSNILIVGHSLGAHCAGLTAKRVRSGKVPRVVGLDPAGPLFSANAPNDRLDRNDATFVEVIHTNTGSIGLGITDPIGHVDIYPTYGGIQPGCGSDITGACSHGRAYQFFAESLTSTGGFNCRRCSDMGQINNKNCATNLGSIKMGGEPLNTKTNGVFYCEVNASSPFAK